MGNTVRARLQRAPGEHPPEGSRLERLHRRMLPRLRQQAAAGQRQSARCHHGQLCAYLLVRSTAGKAKDKVGSIMCAPLSELAGRWSGFR